MGYVVKAKPEDFVVEEQADLPLSKHGEYAVYRLVKTDRNTDEVMQSYARHAGVLARDCAYGGRKDKHGITSQYVTIRSRNICPVENKFYTLRFVGFMDRPMGPDLIDGNAFTVIVRKLSRQDVTHAYQEIACIKQCGFANYFDDQRFGSFDKKQGFLAEKILKKEFNGALKIYLTSVRAQDRRSEKERKSFFFERWRDWEACSNRAETDFEKKAFLYLKGHPNGFLALLQEIPRHELSIYFSAFQSFLWNEIERRYMLQQDVPLLRHEGAVGEYMFYRHVPVSHLQQLQETVIPMPGSKAVMPGEPIDSLYQSVLAQHKITKGLFNGQKVRTVYCKSFPRAAVVMPRDLVLSEHEDDMYAGAMKLSLSFFLARGAFATMLIKRIFSVGYSIIRN